MRRNERLLLIDDSKHWWLSKKDYLKKTWIDFLEISSFSYSRWRVQNTRMQTGYVPSNYVRKEKPSIFDSIKKKVRVIKEKKLVEIFTFRWKEGGTREQGAELFHPPTQVLCTAYPLPHTQVSTPLLPHTSKYPVPHTQVSTPSDKSVPLLHKQKILSS